MARRFLKTAALFISCILVLSAVLFFVLPLPGDIPVLMYHFVDTPERARQEKNVVSRDAFARQMEFLNRFGYQVITLDEFYKIKTGKQKPCGREIVITFDDGNYTFAEQAFPILQKYRFPSAIFVITENIQKGLYGSMSEETLRKLNSSGLVTIASHSKTHPNLSQLGEEKIRKELLESKQILESMLETQVKDLAYPGGDFDARVIRLAKDAGYRMAFTTSYKKLNALPSGIYALTRLKITRTSDFLPIYWIEVSGLYDFFKSRFR